MNFNIYLVFYYNFLKIALTCLFTKSKFLIIS